jgi:hypothetical protein
MLLMVRGPDPVLVNVTVCAALVVPTFWLANVSFAGTKLTAGATPVPLKGTLNWLPEILSVIVNSPLRVPVAVGVKVTAMVQFAPGVKLVTQVLLCAKSPVTAMLGVKTELPLLVTLTLCAALVVPTSWSANVRLVLESVTTGACSRTLTLLLTTLAAARSSLPSLLKSPKTSASAPPPP